MEKADLGLLIVVLAYIGITFADIVEWINNVVAEYGKLILFVLVVYLLHKSTK